MVTLLSIPWIRPEPFRLVPLPDLGVEWLPDAIYVHVFGMMVALGVLVGALVADRKGRREGIHPRVLGELMGYVMIGGFVLGHVLDAVFYHWDTVVAQPLFLLQIWNGLSSFGGFVGAVVGGLIWARMRKADLIAFADPIAFSFPFGWTFGRIGCFFAHDHPGSVTTFFLGVEDYRITGMLGPWQTRHDLGLYEAIFSAMVAVLFLGLGRKRRRRGLYLALLPIVYAPVRFGLDFLRATDVPQADPRFLGLTPGHYGAIALLLVGVAVAAWVWRRPEPTIPGDLGYRPEPEPVSEPAEPAAEAEPPPAAAGESKPA